MNDGAIVIKAKIDTGELDKGLTEVEGKVTKSANNLAGILKGGAIAGLVAGASKLAVDMGKKINAETEKVMAKLKGASTLYQGVAVDQERLVQSLSAIAVETGESLENLGQSVYDALSAGVKPTEDMSEVLKVVASSAKLAKGGFTDVSTALSASMKVVNAYGLSVDNLDTIQGILVQTQNRGITTVNELGASLAQVVPTASAFGVSFEQVGASLSTMTRQGTKTAQATTQLNAIIAELGKSGTTASKNLKASAESAGLAETDFKSLLESGKSLGEILDLMNSYAVANGQSMVDMFSSIEAGKASLQLTGKNLEGFSEDLKAMSTSAGLVEEAFSKTVDPTQRLSTAWDALAVSLGTKFKPTADAVRTILADTILKLAGQGSASDKLKGSTEELTKKAKEFKRIQEETKGAIDATTTALKIQTAEDLKKGMKTFVSDYNEALKTIKRAEGDLDGVNEQLVVNREELYGLYEEYRSLFDGSNFDEWVDSAINATGKLGGESKSIRNLVVQFKKDIYDLEDLQYKFEKEKKTAEQQVADSVKALAEAVMDETLRMENIALWSPEFAQRVKEAIPLIEEERNAVVELAEGTDGLDDSTETVTDLELELGKALAEVNRRYDDYAQTHEYLEENVKGEADKLEELTALYIEYIDKGLHPSDEAMKDLASDINRLTFSIESQKDLSKDLQTEMNTLNEEYNSLRYSSSSVAREMYSQEAHIATLKNLYADYIKKGLKPTDTVMIKLLETINGLKVTTDEYAELMTSFTKTFEDTEREFRRLEEAGDLLGETLYSQEDEFNALTKVYESFIKQGVKPSEKGMVDLKNRIEALDKSIKASRKEVSVWEDELNEMGKTALNSLAGDMTQAMGTLFAELIDHKSALDELDRKILDNTTDLAEVESQMATTETELIKAKARGDSAEIAKAQEKLNLLKKQREGIEANNKELENERKAVENGTTAWKAFAKSSLLALASVLEGLGHQLTAMAVSTYPNVGQMIASGAGAVGAYTASSLLKNYAGQFATGGIVGGNSYSGDNMIARVNSGELIMNVAQQKSLAKVLDSASAFASVGGGGIVVNMSGAYIYGLDSEEVGRAIYNNIENLKHEGVI